ncbi:MAG: hypothetical protein K0S32_3849 [Bacteroidetes bacterium]|jgi:PAS domain S-box-containing protein|nr:hypothetical protein [Bacteroidota bacterium]
MNEQANSLIQRVFNVSSEALIYLETAGQDFTICFLNERSKKIIGKDVTGENLSQINSCKQLFEFCKTVGPDKKTEGSFLINNRTYHITASANATSVILSLKTQLKAGTPLSEEAPEKSKLFIEEVTSTIPDLVSIYDVTSDSVIYANKNDYWNKLFNIPITGKKELLRIGEYIHPDWLKEAKQFTKKRKELEGDNSIETELKLINEKWIKIRSKAFKRNTGGQITQIISVTTCITNCKNSEQQIKYQSHFIEGITHGMPDIVTVVDHPSGKIAFNNRDPLTALGFTPEEIKALAPAERMRYLVHPDDHEGFRKFQNKINSLPDNRIEEFEYRGNNKKGEVFWLRVRSSVFTRYSDGSPKQFLHIGQNISAQKKAEGQITDQLHLMNQIAFAMPDMLSVIDLETQKIYYGNKEPFALNGFSVEELQVMSTEELAEIIHPEDRLPLNSYFEIFKTCSDEDIHEIEYRAMTKEGLWKWFRARGKIFSRDKNNRPTHCVNIVQNIHQFKESELNLKATVGRLKYIKGLFEEAEKIGSMGSWEKNLTTGKLFWSDELYCIYGLSPQSVEITSQYYVNNFVHPDDKKKTFLHIKSIYEKNCEEAAEYRIITHEGEKVLLSQPRITYNEEGVAVFIRGVVRDITAQKIAEQEMMSFRLNQQKEILNAVLLAQEQERERIGESLHNGVAQQLYGIQTRLQLVGSNNGNDKEKLRELIAIVNEAINDTRRISFELVPAVLKDYGIEVALRNLFQRMIKDNLSIQVKISGINKRLPEKVEYAVFRMVQELVNNIVKHSGATIATVNISLVTKVLNISVSDNGNGFDENKNTSIGGLGLQSIKNRVKFLDGIIKINSSSSGTGILIKIPLN